MCCNDQHLGYGGVLGPPDSMKILERIIIIISNDRRHGMRLGAATSLGADGTRSN
jgi:hypothetical protein